VSPVPARNLRLKDCGCCDGVSVETPLVVHNRAGLRAVEYRVGTYASFTESLLARLSVPLDKDAGETLSRLRTRESDDFSIAMLDAWAIVADILTFYQERIANESYLRTAVERLSVLELANLIGYRPAPGVAASTWLAFALDEAPGAPDKEIKQTLIDSGTKVQSTPEPGEDAQLFETVVPIAARVEWNAIKPRLAAAHPVAGPAKQFVLDDANTRIDVGDVVVVMESGVAQVICTVSGVERRRSDEIAVVSFIDRTNALPQIVDPSLPEGSIDDFPPSTALDSTIVDALLARRWRTKDLCALADIQQWDVADMTEAIDQRVRQRDTSTNTGLFVFRQQASLFGHNSIPQVEYKDDGTPELQSNWKEWELADGEAANVMYLDAAYRGVVEGGYVIATQGTGKAQMAYTISKVENVSRSAYGQSGRSTRIELAGTWWNATDIDILRNASVMVQSEQLPLADVPDESPVAGDEIRLDEAYIDLKPGQFVAVSGERRDLEGTKASEVRRLHEVWLDGGQTVLVLDRALDHIYRRSSVSINANVAPATHGETVREVLGSGDASKPFQRFVLSFNPLTWVSASTTSGRKTTLEVRVNNVRWQEVDTFYEVGPNEQVYVTRQDDSGRTAVQFGDGVHGARLMTGSNNVRAEYRRGIGTAGLLKAKQLDVLMSQPLGVKSAVNPVATSGGDDAESRDDARRNAPLTVRTLDRAVSLQDYEDFARSFAGIAKAQAVWIFDGSQNEVFLTVAGPDGTAVEEGGSVHASLHGALQGSGDPYAKISSATFVAAFFRLHAKVIVHIDHEAEKVLEAVRGSVRQAFRFERREFVQPVALSEVISIMQSVPGVVAVDVDALYRSDAAQPSLESRLPVRPTTRAPGGEILAAELLLLDPAPLVDTVVAA
jgi:hypothetical protein